MRFQRQTAFEPFGEKGQCRLEQGRVLIVGCGALGGTVADLLVRAGTGIQGGGITLIDPDVVEIGNLHRQTLFTEKDASQRSYKVEAAKKHLLEACSGANLETIVGRFDERTSSMAEPFDLLIDATDNFSTRFVLNRAAVQYRKPMISAGVMGASGQVLTILPGITPCLECLFDPNENRDVESASYGILAPLPQIFASFEALEAMKILSDHFDAVNRRILSVDLWNYKIQMINTRRNENCPVCGQVESNGCSKNALQAWRTSGR